MNRRTDRIIGIVLLALGIFWGALTPQINDPSSTGAPGPRFFPYLLAAAIAILGIWLFATTFRPAKADEAAAAQEGEGAAPTPASEAVMVGKTFGLLILYVAAVTHLGFLVSTPIALIAAMRWLMGLRSWPRMLAVGVGIGLVLYLAFGVVLNVPLPRGLLV